jgi:hypothetical protein
VPATTTPVLGLTKPDFEGPADIRTISTDMDIIDTAFGGVTPQLVLPVRGPTGGVLLAGDTNLHSPSANVLMTDDQFQATGDLRAREASAQRVVVGAVGANAGVLLGATGDVNLYRSAADTLRTDDAFVVGGALTATNGAAVTGNVGVSGDLTVAGTINLVASQNALQNMLTNPGFEVWQRGTGPFALDGAVAADRWQLSVGASSTLSVGRDASTNADTGSVYDAACTYVHGTASALYQKMEDYGQLRGRTVTFAVRVKTAAAGAVRARVWDSVNGFRDGAFHTGSGAYETLTVTAPIAATATGVQVFVQFNASATAYVDNAVLVVGSAAPTYAPLGPADDLTRCQRYYYEVGGLHANEAAATMHSFAGGQARGTLRFPVEMAVAPAMAVSAPGDWALYTSAGVIVACTGIAPVVLTRRSVLFDATCAGGLLAGGGTTLIANSTLAARIRFEANPP